jgi:hypothetical protein
MDLNEMVQGYAASISYGAINWLLANDDEIVDGINDAAKAYRELCDAGLDNVALIAAHCTAYTMRHGQAPIKGEASGYLQQLHDMAYCSDDENEEVGMTKEQQHLEKCLGLM